VILGITFAVIVALFWAFGEIKYSKISKKIDSPNVYFYQYLTRGIIYTVVALIFNIGIFGKFIVSDFLKLLPIIMCDLVGSYVINKSVKNGELSSVSPIMAAYPIVDIILGILLLRESVGILELVLVVVISISIIVLAANTEKTKYAPHPIWGIIFAVIYMFLTAFSSYFEKDAYLSNLSVYDLYYYKGMVYFIASMFFLSVVGVSKVKLKKPTKDIILGTAIIPIGNVFYSFALKFGNMMIVTPVSSIYSVISNIGSRRVLKEKITYLERICIALIMISTFTLIICGLL
jgi:drug/metabolite transporter (DMT)-like permease